jgi:hypothetical protein
VRVRGIGFLAQGVNEQEDEAENLTMGIGPVAKRTCLYVR